MSPAKKHQSMGVISLDALVQLFACRPLDSSLPKPQLKTVLTDRFITPQQMVENAEAVMHAVTEATVIVKTSNRWTVDNGAKGC